MMIESCRDPSEESRRGGGIAATLKTNRANYEPLRTAMTSQNNIIGLILLTCDVEPIQRFDSVSPNGFDS